MFKHEPFFDAEFYLQRLEEARLYCSARAKYGYDQEYNFVTMLDLAYSNLERYKRCSGARADRISFYADAFDALYIDHQNYLLQQDIDEELCEEVMQHHEARQSVHQEAAPAQMQMCRVLGQVEKNKITVGLSPLSLDWRPSDRIPTKLLSFTRPSGGLEQCQ